MRSSTLSLATVALAASQLVGAQTYTDCNPLTASNCPSDPALGKTITTDFTAGEEAVLADYTYSTGTSLTFDPTTGAAFAINSTTSAPTITSNKYIFFGKVDVVMRASPGTGIVSSFVLQSDDLDEIDWEFLGSTDGSVQSNFFGKGNTTTYDRALPLAASSVIETFHTYTVIWTSSSVQWQVDGTTLRTLNYGDASAVGGQNYPQTPMRIKMGNWVGCADAAAAANPATQGTCEWAGGYPDWSTAPFTQYVKSVSIQDYGCAESYSYGDNTGSFSSIVSNGGCSNDTSSTDTSTTASSSAAPATTKAESSSSAAASGGVFAESSTGTAETSTETAKSSTVTAKSTASGSSSASSTLSSSSSKSTSGSSSSTTSSSPAQLTTSSANGMKPKHQYGTIDIAVVMLGLALGYLVM